MTMMGTIHDLLAIVSDERGENTMERVIKTMGNVIRGGVVPAIYTQSARRVESLLDMPAKDVRNTVLGYLYQDIPVIRGGLYDRLNFLGEPVIPEGGFLPRFLGNAKTDYVAEIINRGWTPSVPAPNSLSGYDPALGKERLFTEEEQFTFYKVRGALLKRYLAMNKDNLLSADKTKLDEGMGDVEGKLTTMAKKYIMFKGSNNKWAFRPAEDIKQAIENVDERLEEIREEIRSLEQAQ